MASSRRNSKSVTMASSRRNSADGHAPGSAAEAPPAGGSDDEWSDDEWSDEQWRIFVEMCDEGVRARLAAPCGPVAAAPAGQRERKRKQYDRKRSSAKRKRSRANAPAAAVPPTADAQGCDNPATAAAAMPMWGQAISPATRGASRCWPSCRLRNAMFHLGSKNVSLSERLPQQLHVEYRSSRVAQEAVPRRWMLSSRCSWRAAKLSDDERQCATRSASRSVSARSSLLCRSSAGARLSGSDEPRLKCCSIQFPLLSRTLTLTRTSHLASLSSSRSPWSHCR